MRGERESGWVGGGESTSKGGASDEVGLLQSSFECDLLFGPPASDHGKEEGRRKSTEEVRKNGGGSY